MIPIQKAERRDPDPNEYAHDCPVHAYKEARIKPRSEMEI